MKKSFIGGCLSSLLMLGCVSTQQIDLNGNQTDGTSQEAKIQESALATNGGVIDFDWQLAAKASELTKTDSSMTISLKEEKKASLYKNLDGLDFRGKLVIRVDASIPEGQDDVRLRLRLTDRDNLVSNGKDIDQVVKASGETRPYFFRLKGAFVQTFPEIKNLNGADIKKLEFLMQPVGGAVTSDIEISNIKVVSDQEAFNTSRMSAEGKQGGIVYSGDSPGDVDSWQTNSLYEISYVGEDMVVKCNGTGIRYERFEKEIATTKASKLRIVAKYEGELQPYLRFDLFDANGFVTNRKPGMVRLQPGDYQEYIIDYSDRARQSYPSRTDVDLSRIVKIDGLVNPAFMPFEGTVYIKSLQLF